ncbi:dUTP diphosphatase [Candidatus Woesearchaeota archaeon]|nr:dUTP diphosphatase [Candidatus Woesearchaeota archaeon]
MKVQVQRIGDTELPRYSKKGDAGLDLCSAEETILKPNEKKIIRTGIKIAIPEGYVGLIWDRSGIAAKNGIHTMAGVVDSGYRGEICVVMKNLGEEEFRVTKNMRICQMVIQPVLRADIEESDSLDETERKDSGFGSSGIS